MKEKAAAWQLFLFLRSVMRTLFLSMFTVALSACTTGSRKPDVRMEETLQRQVNKNTTTDKRKQEVQALPQPLALQPARFKFHDIRWSAQCTADSVLIALFPGTVGEAEDHAYTLWTCPDCEVISFPSWLDNQPEFFPDNQGMETNTVAEYTYTEKGKTYRTVFFSSHDVRYGEPGGGRFNGAVLGAARLEQIADGWELDAFTPAVGCTGMYDEAAAPDTMRMPDGRMGFILLDKNGGPDGPVFGNYYIYGFEGTAFSCQLSLVDGYCKYGEHSWATQINFIAKGTGYPDIIANTIGDYTATTEEEMKPYHLPQPWDNIFSQKEYNHYIITQTYRFQNKAYHLQSRKTDLSHK